MSMRDFLTRVLNTPGLGETTPSIVVETTPRTVVESSPPIMVETVPRIVVETVPPVVLETVPRIVVETTPPIAPSSCEGSPEQPFYWDIESRSAAVLGGGKHGVGARAYAEHPTTEVLCVSYAHGKGPIETWVPGQPIPEVVRAAAADPRCPWVAHNAAFERAMFECILVPLHGWPTVPVERHVCTMSVALATAYPGNLEGVAEAIGLENRKDVAREKIVRVMWKPRKPRRGEDPTKIYYVDSRELRAELIAYNRQDVAVERELHQHPKLTRLPASEQDTWVIDAEINDRGVYIDAPLGSAAVALTAQANVDLDERMRHETDGAVDKASKPKKLKTWLVLQGVKLPRRPRKQKSGVQWEDCLEADDIEKLLAGDLPNARVRSALEIRLQAAQSAASKIDRMLRTRCADGRVRNLYKIYGAVTGRWSGEGFQPQNLKRPELLRTDEAIAEAIAMVLVRDYAAIKERYGDVLGVIGDLCRSMLIPAPEHRFIIGDFSAVEARVLAFLAGDADKLEAFRQFDLGLGRDLYCVTAEQVLGLADVEDKSPERQLGKIFELGLGYSMGGDKLLATIRKANIPNTEQVTVAETTHWVQKWRQRNPTIVGYWAALEAAAMTAVRNPGTVIPCRTVSFAMRENVLILRLLSGRELNYPAPSIKPGRFGQQQITFLDMEAGRRRGKHIYGGKWAENVASAAARDLLVEAMKRLRAAGYALVLHTHDEIVAEMPIGQGSVEEFKRLLVEVPAWAQELPIAAKVFEHDRFKKDYTESLKL
jgi:DNA polymerase